MANFAMAQMEVLFYICLLIIPMSLFFWLGYIVYRTYKYIQPILKPVVSFAAGKIRDVRTALMETEDIPDVPEVEVVPVKVVNFGNPNPPEPSSEPEEEEEETPFPEAIPEEEAEEEETPVGEDELNEALNEVAGGFTNPQLTEEELKALAN